MGVLLAFLIHSIGHPASCPFSLALFLLYLAFGDTRWCRVSFWPGSSSTAAPRARSSSPQPGMLAPHISQYIQCRAYLKLHFALSVGVVVLIWLANCPDDYRLYGLIRFLNSIACMIFSVDFSVRVIVFEGHLAMPSKFDFRKQARRADKLPPVLFTSCCRPGQQFFTPVPLCFSSSCRHV